VECVVEQTTGDLPPDLDTILAWTVREGVTNAIRHSRTQRCLIRLTRNQGMVEAVVLNDGERQEDQRDKRTSQGLGLSGLRERVAALEGTMEAGPLVLSGKTYFRLWVAFPLQNCGEPGKRVGVPGGNQEEGA
jgi:two-component system, NarL family, sensor histidine kinase DesK